MMAKINKNDFERAVILLDGCLDALDAAAMMEKDYEKGKVIENVTHRKRADIVRAFVEDMTKLYSIEL